MSDLIKEKFEEYLEANMRQLKIKSKNNINDKNNINKISKKQQVQLKNDIQKNRDQNEKKENTINNDNNKLMTKNEILDNYKIDESVFIKWENKGKIRKSGKMKGNQNLYYINKENKESITVKEFLFSLFQYEIFDSYIKILTNKQSKMTQMFDKYSNQIIKLPKITNNKNENDLLKSNEEDLDDESIEEINNNTNKTFLLEFSKLLIIQNIVIFLLLETVIYFYSHSILNEDIITEGILSSLKNDISYIKQLVMNSVYLKKFYSILNSFDDLKNKSLMKKFIINIYKDNQVKSLNLYEDFINELKNVDKNKMIVFNNSSEIKKLENYLLKRLDFELPNIMKSTIISVSKSFGNNKAPWFVKAAKVLETLANKFNK